MTRAQKRRRRRKLREAWIDFKYVKTHVEYLEPSPDKKMKLAIAKKILEDPSKFSDEFIDRFMELAQI